MHICWGFKKINSSHTTEDETLFRIILSRLKEIQDFAYEQNGFDEKSYTGSS